ncbi:MAG TPA: glycogen/starch/alpha-glucan phosphorylase [Burkholderiaceae bacterium]|nr:glycogen/starch/alpha-glucan phosphorylase [Burkholderiaceae bacterium]
MSNRTSADAFHYDSARSDRESLQRAVANQLLYTVGKDPVVAQGPDWYHALAKVVRDRLVERWMETTRRQYGQRVKRVYYLSMEFLVGRALSNSLMALGLQDEFGAVLRDMGLDLDEAAEHEPDAALGNGGLGRLAACFLDSMATLGLPSYGYGIRYDYGMFAQRIHDGYQVEQPDDWLRNGNPWEFARPEVTFAVSFGGWVRHDGAGAHWVDTEEVLATAYDTIIPGYGTRSVNTLRLWHAKATESLDLEMFNQGDYMRAVQSKVLSENVTRVLYPDDSSYHGRELRLRQEYFFVSASLQDVLHRYMHDHADFSQLSDKVAIHLNDTHPAIAVPELMRLLVDVHRLSWDDAWSHCTRIFSYTNHTLMPEALETWPVGMMRSVLPRHLEIILEINRRFLEWVRSASDEGPDLLRRVSLIDETGERRVRMAYLCVVASHKVNGVSKLHSELITKTVFADFARLFPDRFCNKTNGITPRRWLANANRALSSVIDERIGRDWRTDLDQLARLRAFAQDPQTLAAIGAAKMHNKRRLADLVRRQLRISIDPESMYDVQVKRIHEYKRQLLNALHIVARYNAILERPDANWVPRTFVFAGKAASAYRMAKLIIKLINDVAVVVNQDPLVNRLMKVVFLANYGVSLAEAIMPAADLSEQISTAGTEASGTGNMKLALNGALTIGTLDGANIEIRENVGADNIFIFGHTADEVAAIKAQGYDPSRHYQQDRMLRQVLDQIGSGRFSPDDPSRFRPIVDSLLRGGDTYLLLADFASYVETQLKVDALYRQPSEWNRKALLNIAGMGPFSSDRTIAEYAREIWKVEPLAP